MCTVILHLQIAYEYMKQSKYNTNNSKFTHKNTILSFVFVPNHLIFSITHNKKLPSAIPFLHFVQSNVLSPCPENLIFLTKKLSIFISDTGKIIPRVYFKGKNRKILTLKSEISMLSDPLQSPRHM